MGAVAGGFGAAVAVEWIKFRRSNVALVATAVHLVALPGLVIWLVAASGLLTGVPAATPLGAKAAALVPGRGMAALFAAAGQVSSVAPMLLVGVPLAWSVGREFVEGTVTSLFAEPVDRVATALAKQVVVTGWALGCTLVVAVELGVVGVLSGADGSGAASGLVRLVVVAVLAVALAQPVAWVAVAARSYLAAIGALLGLVVVTQLVAASGYGRHWPWSAPSLWVGMGGAEAAAAVRPGDLAAAAPVAVVAVAGVWWSWRRLELT